MRNVGHAASGTRRGTVLAALLALALVGCGGQSELSGGDHTIFVHGRSLLPRGGQDALIQGTLALRDGCVLLEQDEFAIAYPVIWPSGTSIVSDDPLTLQLPSGEELTVGQAVSGGGGYASASSDQVEVDIPSECVPDSDEVAAFSPDADPAVVE